MIIIIVLVYMLTSEPMPQFHMFHRPDMFSGTMARDVSDNGTVIGNMFGRIGETFYGSDGFIWKRKWGIISIRTLLETLGYNTNNIQSIAVMGISNNGKIITGEGYMIDSGRWDDRGYFTYSKLFAWRLDISDEQLSQIYKRGDFNFDGNIDQQDFGIIQRCVGSSTRPYLPMCGPCDLNDDEKIDKYDRDILLQRKK